FAQANYAAPKTATRRFGRGPTEQRADATGSATTAATSTEQRCDQRLNDQGFGSDPSEVRNDRVSQILERELASGGQINESILDAAQAVRYQVVGLTGNVCGVEGVILECRVRAIGPIRPRCVHLGVIVAGGLQLFFERTLENLCLFVVGILIDLPADFVAA